MYAKSHHRNHTCSHPHRAVKLVTLKQPIDPFQPVPVPSDAQSYVPTSDQSAKVWRLSAVDGSNQYQTWTTGPVQRIERIWEDHPTAETKSGTQRPQRWLCFILKLLACDAFQVHFGLCWGPLFKGPHGWETHSQVVRCSDIAVKFGRTEIQL